MNKAAIVTDALSVSAALITVLWLYLDPGPEPFVASLASLVAILVIVIQAQVKLAKVQDESLSKRLHSIQEIRRVIDDIPRVDRGELYYKLFNNDDLCNSLTSRLVRLFGLRRELIPYLEQELVDLIDNEFEQFYVIEVGHYTFRKEKLYEFAVCVDKLAKVVREFEKKLTDEHRKRFG